jgi:hypothetical protein
MTQTLRIVLAGTMVLILISCSGGGEKFARAFASPARDYDAVLVTETGGGPGSSYCIDTVVVVPSEILASGIYPANDRAYVGGCHQLKMIQINGRASMPNAPQIRWTGPYELSIVYNPTFARQGVSALYTATSLHNGKITIRHETQ